MPRHSRPPTRRGPKWWRAVTWPRAGCLLVAIGGFALMLAVAIVDGDQDRWLLVGTVMAISGAVAAGIELVIASARSA